MAPGRARVKEPVAGLKQGVLTWLGKKIQSEFVFQLLKK